MSGRKAPPQRPPREPSRDELIPLGEAVRRFRDAMSGSMLVRLATHMGQTVDGQLTWLAYAVWRLAPLQVKYKASDAFEPMTYHEGAEWLLEFRTGQPQLVSLWPGDIVGPVTSEIRILARDLETAIAKAKEVEA